MSSEHTISIAAASQPDSHRDFGRSISIPVGELLTSNGLVVGQSGANSASSVRRIVESLLDVGETVLVVDPTGEFVPVTDEPSVLHVGGDRNCDVQVGPDAVDRVASLVLDGNTSIVLDLTAFEQGTVDDILGGLTDELVDDRRQQRSEMLLVVGECHRWLAADGPAARTSENIVHLGGRRHDGVGVLGVTDQPADVRSDVLTGVDWLLAHRVTWREDVRALEQLLDRQYTAALDDLDDGEAFFSAGWYEGVRRVRFDDGGEPMADDTPTNQKRDDDSSVDDGDDLLAGLAGARSPNGTDESDDTDKLDETDEPHQRNQADDGRVGRSDDTIRSKDVADLRDEFADLRDEFGDLRVEFGDLRGEFGDLRDDVAPIENRLASLEATLDAREDVEDLADRLASAIEGLQAGNSSAVVGNEKSESSSTVTERSTGSTGVDDSNRGDSRTDEGETDESTKDGPGGFGDVFGTLDDDGSGTEPADNASTSSATGSSPDGSSAHSGNGSSSDGMSFEPIDFGFDDPTAAVDSTVPDDFGPPSRPGSSGRTIPRYLRTIVRSLEEMDVTSRRMLAYYIEEGTESPMDAHFSAGGGGDRTRAYAHNRQLRTNGLVEHVGKGEYAPRLREYVVDEAGHSVPEHELDRAVDIIRQTVEDGR